MMPDAVDSRGGVEQVLEALTEAWLGRNQAQFNPRFAPALEKQYRAEGQAVRLRDRRLSSLIGLLTAAAATPLVWRMLPDSHATMRVLWFGMVLPLCAVSHGLMWTRLSPRWQEAQTAASDVLVALAVALLLRSSAFGSASVLLGALVLILLLGVIGSRYDFPVAAAMAVSLFAIFAGTVGHVQRQSDISAALLTVLMAMISACTLFGGWRLETETRRSYALMLRARLGQLDLSRRNSELDQLARRDPLTGLANRRAYDAWLGASWQRAASSGAPVGLLTLDIDFFKMYNDFYGHPAGDVCLQTVATCIAEQLRGTSDLVARVGGEEFSIILPGLGLSTCGDIAERLRGAVVALELPHFGIGTADLLSISVGVASLVPAAGLSPHALAASADAALYAAKQAGRNCVFMAGQDGAEDPAASMRLRRLGVPD